MKIIYPISMFPKLSETFILEQITGLLDMGHDVRIVAFQPTDELLVHPQVDSYHLQARTTYIKRLPDDSGIDFGPELVALLHDADIIHAHFAAQTTDFAMEASRRFDIPFIFTTHAFDIFVHTPAGRLAEYAAAASTIITVTEFNKRYMLDRIGERFQDKIEIIRCGIDVERFTPVKRPVQEHVTILTTGRLVEKKGISYAVRAMWALPAGCSATLRVIGDGPLRGEIETIIAELNLHDCVKLLGSLAQSEVIREMQEADIFLLPSVTAANNDREGLPVALLEAQAMRLPVVSTHHTGIPEGVAHGVTGLLVAERDIEALAGALTELIRNPALRHTMGEAGRANIKASFDLGNELGKLEVIMQRAVDSRFTRDEKGPLLRKTKVLVISHSAYFNGAEQSLLFFLQNMDRVKYEPVVVLPMELPKGENIFGSQLQEAGIKVLFLPSPMWINFGDEDALLRDFLIDCTDAQRVADLILEEQADIIYTNTLTKLSGAIAASMTGTPHVYHVREILKDHRLKSPVSLEGTFRLIDAFSSKIIVNSHAVADQFSATASQKLKVVHNAIDVSNFVNRSQQGKLRSELGLPPSTGLIGIIGTVHEHKNQMDLVHAFALVRQRVAGARLLIIGDSLGDYGNRVHALVGTLGLEDSVSFIAFRNDIPEIMSELDVVVVASLAEPFGRTTIEAMAARRPVIATNTGASPEIVVDGVTGFLVPLHDNETMAEKIITLLTDPETANRMGEAGFRRVAAEFGAQKYVDGIEDVFEEIKQIPQRRLQVPGYLVLHAALQVLDPADFHQIVSRITIKCDTLSWYVNGLLSSSTTLNSEIDCQRRLLKEHSDKIIDLCQELQHKIDEEKHLLFIQEQMKEIIVQKDENILQLSDLVKQKDYEISVANNEISKKDEEIRKKFHEVERLETQRLDIMRSLSWRLTSPLRKIFSVLK
jgi:glycosyltransferase involved in cell wall biosynthesis